MAIGLTLLLQDPVVPTALARGTEELLRRLTGQEQIPAVTIHELDEGHLRDLEAPDAALAPGRVLCLGLEAREDIVTVQVHLEDRQLHTTLQAGATRDATEYVLLLAAALHLGISRKAPIEDGFGFWSSDGTISAPEFLDGLGAEQVSTFEAACQALVDERAPGAS